MCSLLLIFIGYSGAGSGSGCSGSAGGTGSASKVTPGVTVIPVVISIGIVIYLCCSVNKKAPEGAFLVACEKPCSD
jgi:L-aminopeptidase/D-esterase-like protein